ncbi:MAG TPA: zinc ribbon domain-containing protein [Firmicutes bacterium]|nr:zinc ribbon domain-containing protein [Bacillota bacterium]
MPDYEFVCKRCGHRFTVTVPWQKKSETTCPRCGSDELKERFSFLGWGRGGADVGACTTSSRFG